MPKVTLKVEDVTPSGGVKVERMNYRDYKRFKNKLERKPMGVKSDRWVNCCNSKGYGSSDNYFFQNFYASPWCTNLK